MDDRTRFRMLVVTSIVVTAGVLAFLALIMTAEPADSEVYLLMLLIAAVVIALPLVLLLRVRRDVKGGFPLDDERGRAVKQKAGYYAFMAAIYIVLAFMYYDFIFVEVFEAPSLSPTEYFLILDFILLGVYVAFWWWFSRKGEIDG